ncbi:MAG: hypothetical protein ACXVVQ_03060 [Solirubrobacteraceae bacterium]
MPFPRDWLGPREELIPFGSSAEQSAAAPGAEAFWGGECDPLHAVVTSPARAAAIAGRRFPQLGSRVAVGALVVALLAAAVFGRIVGVPTGGSSPAVDSNVAAAGFFDLALLRGAVGAPAVEASNPAVHHSVRLRGRSAARVRHRRPVVARDSGARSTATASSTTSVAAAPVTSGSHPVSSTPSSGATTESTATSSSPTHSSVSSHTANVRPGPVGPGAPFGPGQLK